MAKGSGDTRGAKSGNSKSSKSWDELKDGWTASLALYRETDRYSAADVKAFEREIENSSFTGPLSRATIFYSENEYKSFINKIEKQGELRTLEDYMAPIDAQSKVMGFYSKRKRTVVSFSSGTVDPNYMHSDYYDEIGAAYYPVVFRKNNNRTVHGKYLVSEGEVAVSIKKTKFNVDKITKVRSNDFETGFYTVIDIS